MYTQAVGINDFVFRTSVVEPAGTSVHYMSETIPLRTRLCIELQYIVKAC